MNKLKLFIDGERVFKKDIIGITVSKTLVISVRIKHPTKEDEYLIVDSQLRNIELRYEGQS